MTKQTGSRQLFYRHFDYILGNIPPKYVTAKLIENTENLQNKDTIKNTTGTNMNMTSDPVIHIVCTDLRQEIMCS
jgi:hypothetical protein